MTVRVKTTVLVFVSNVVGFVIVIVDVIVSRAIIMSGRAFVPSVIATGDVLASNALVMPPPMNAILIYATRAGRRYTLDPCRLWNDI